MYLTDEQIMLLEQLTYLTDDVADAAGVLLGPYDSVEDLLQQFDDDALQRLEDPGNPDSTKDYTGGKKWAAIIRQIKSDPDLYSLDIVNKDDSVPAICFNDPDDPEHAVVVFRGTSGKDEWIDNAIGLGVSDTERQKAALDYIENLPYDSITVAGHSKGGNKAQYVTVLSDKVDRCISMDGQGFSQEFIDKYYAEIQKKGHCIKNYYLEGDFVSILMFPVPGSDQICIDGDDSVIGAENHAASSFYQFWQDEEGRWHGRRKTEKVHGTRNEYRLVEQDGFLLVDGLHEAIISEEVWNAAQAKLIAQAKKYEHVNKGKDERTHLLSGIVRCPVCGAGMYGNKSIKYKKDGTKYKDFFYYGCKHRSMQRGHKCDYKKQIREELLDDAVAEVIVKLVSNPQFAAMMQEKINMKVDTTAIDQEIANYEKQLRQDYSIKAKLMEEIDNLNPDDRHYIRRKADLDDRLYRMYDKIEELEEQLIAARAKKTSIEAEKITGDNIYKVLIYFDKLYFAMSDVERRQLIEALIAEIQIYEERKPNGQWLKSIRFKLPIIENDLSIGLDNGNQVETVVLLHYYEKDGDRV